MIAILSLLVVVTLSILVTRVATLALTHTGLSREAARFQARSAFSGAGFTTAESEKVVTHPVRRRIVMLLMLLGNAGIVTAVSSLILTFVGDGSGNLALKVVLLACGLALLWAIAASPWVDRHLSRLIDRVLKKYTRLDVSDYASLLHLAGDYRIAEMQVEEEDWLAGKTLQEARLSEEGIVVLGVERPDGTYLGAPRGGCRILPNDALTLYGRTAAIEELDRRRKTGGDWEHHEAIVEQRFVEEEERRQDAAQQAGEPEQAEGGKPA